MSVSIDQFYSNEPIQVLKPAPRGNNLGMMQAIENTGIQVPENDPFKTLHEAVPGLRVTSQLRTPERNREVGGVENSRHLFGDGIDIGTPTKEQQVGLRRWAGENGFRIKNDYGDGHWHLEPTPGNRRSGGKPDFSNVQGTPGATPVNKEMSVDEFYAGLTPADFSAPPDLAAKRKEDKGFLDNAGDAISRAAKGGFDFIMERLNQEGITQAANAEEAAMGVGQVQRMAIPRENGTLSVGNVAVEAYDDARLRWIEKVRGNPDELRNVPKYMREDVLPYAVSSMPEVKGFIANLENPVQLLLESSMPANLASYYANLPEIARKNLDEARKVQMQENIVANPNKFPAVSVQAAREAIARREAQQDPGVREMWDQLKKAAKEDPGALGAQFVNALMADPYMLAAPIGIGVKPIQGTRALATGTTTAGRATQIADKVIDAGVTAGSMNAAVTAAEGLANAGEIEKKAIAISAGLGAAIGGPLGPIFMRGSRARATISNKSAAEDVLNEALKDLAAEDVAAERMFSETSPEFFNQQPTEVQQRINTLLGIKSDADRAAFHKQYQKDIRELFKTEAEYANYLEFKAQERIDRAEAIAADRTAQNYRDAAAARVAVVEDDAFSALRAERVAQWRDEFDAAISQRDQAAADDILRQTEEAWGIHEADQKWIAKLDADDAMEAAWGADVPQVKRALNKASARDAAMRTPKWQRGEADPKTMARLAAVGLGGGAAFALAPEGDKEIAGLAGALAGLLLPAGGSVMSRMRQSGAVSLDGSFMALPMRRIRKGMSEAEEVAARAGELEMINGAKAGDQAAMKNLYDEYFPYVKRAVDRFLRDAGPRLAVDAEDVAQETMIKVFRNLETFQGNSEFSTWVHAIAKNEALNTITKSKSRPLTEGMESTLRFKDNDMAELGELPTKVEEVNPSTYDTPENFAILGEVQNQLTHAFQRMPEDIKLTMILKELEGFSEAEIAGQLDIPLGTVKSRLSRGRAMVEETLQRGWGAKVRGPQNQRGEIDPKLLKVGGGVAAGAALGLYLSRGGYDQETGEWDGGNRAIAALGGAAFGAAVMAARGRAKGNIIKKAWGSVSTDLLNKAPKIFGRLQHLERVTLEQTHRYIDKGHPFFAALRKVKQPDQDVVARALMTGNADVISKVFKAVGNVELIKHYKALREALDTLGKDLEGLNMIKRTGIEYFPRMVVDKEGLFAAIGKVDEGNVKQALQKANEESLRKNGRTLNAMEESSVINKVLFTDKQSSQPGFAKNRGIQEITPELQKFYAGPQESFNTYVRSAIGEIEKAKFFGKYARKDKEGKLEYINIDKSVSKMMADEINAGMDVDTSREIADILKMRFGPGEQAEPAWVRDVKNLGNIALLGNFWSALTQLGDVGASLYINGFYNTAEAVARKVSGNQKVSMRDFGLADHIAEEFANQRKTATWVNKVFRATLFSATDRLGKDVALNGAILKAGRQLATDSGVQKFKLRYGKIFGDETDKLIKALQKGDVQSDLARDFAFMELARFQPISRIEYPEWYLKYPGARSYLWLQSFTMKQVDLLRRDVWDNFRTGNYGQGFSNLAKVSILMGAANTGVEAIKDYLLGKDVELDWGTMALNMFKNFGWSQYELRQLTGVSKEEAAARRADGDTRARAVKAEPIKAIAGRVVPPYDMFETILRGDPRAWRYLVPGLGPYIAQKVKEADEFEKESRKEGW